MESQEARKTPLYPNHLNLNARMVDFHGWLMPVQYAGVIGEHNFVREKAGLFDVSHMGEFTLTGPKSSDFINRIVTNDIEKASAGQCVYSSMCHENGTIVDDLIVYKHGRDDYMVVVNASNISKDFDWMSGKLGDGATLQNVSDYLNARFAGPEGQGYTRRSL